MARSLSLFTFFAAAGVVAAACAGAPATSTTSPAASSASAPSPTAVITSTVPTAAPTTAVTPSPVLTATAAPASPPPSASAPVASLPPTAPPASAGLPVVSLFFSGSNNFGASGNGGRCILIKDASGNVRSFGWDATEADIQGINGDLSLAELSPGYVDIKWLLDNNAGGYGRPGPAEGGSDSDLVLSADKHTVTIDVELSELHAAGAKGPGPEHIEGTITCP